MTRKSKLSKKSHNIEQKKSAQFQCTQILKFHYDDQGVIEKPSLVLKKGRQKKFLLVM